MRLPQRIVLLQVVVPAATGFLSVVIQIALAREMLTVFHGNELTIGLMFSHWLLGTAIGSLLVLKLPAGKHRETARTLALSFPALALWALAAFLFIRGLRPLLHLLPSDGLSLWNILRSSFIVFFPCGALAGMQFSLNLFCNTGQTSRTSACFCAAAGGFAGASAYPFLLQSCFSLPATLFLLLSGSAGIAGALAPETRLRRLCGAGAAAALLLLPVSGAIESATWPWMYPGYRMVEHIDSPYHRLAVADRNGERAFFSDGIALLSFPNQELVQSEEFGHLPLLFLPHLHRLLLIGGGIKYLPPVFNHAVEQITYIEPEPLLLPLLEKYLPPSFRGLLRDPRVTVTTDDARAFLGSTGDRYDAILIGLASPVTISLNRFYTREFFALAKTKMNEGGVFAFMLPGLPVYIDPALWELNYILWDTIRGVFPYVTVAPGETNIVIASLTPPATPGLLKRRLARTGIDSPFLSPQSISAKFASERQSWIQEQFSTYKGRHAVNADAAPRGMLAALIYQQSIFASRATTLFRFVVKHSWVIILILLLWLLRTGGGVPANAATSGAAAMGLQLLSIGSVQAMSGNIYRLIGPLTAAFMAGAALGILLRRIPFFRENAARAVFFTEASFMAWIVLWGALFRFMPPSLSAFFLLSAGTGALLSAGICSMAGTTADAPAPGIAKIIAAVSLGGWLAALLCGMVLLPAWGTQRTLLFILLLKTAGLKWRLARPALPN